MAGLLEGVLPAIYSAGNTAKRRLGALLRDPAGTLGLGVARFGEDQQQMLNLANEAGYMPGSRSVLVGDKQRALARALLAQKATDAGAGMLGAANVAKTDYRTAHRPMTVEGGAATLDDLTPAFGGDIYGGNALQYFGSGDPRERSTVRLIQALRGKPNELVTVYRGVPEGINAQITRGDWVTLDPKVASEYGAQVLQMKVPASHVTAWPDALLEYGYYPPK